MMGDLSLIEKFRILVDVSSSSGIYIAAGFILVFMIFLLISISRKNTKLIKAAFVIIYVAVTALIVIKYGKYLQNIFDYMMDNFFIVFYFPNLAIYLAAIITTNIILLVSILNLKGDKLLKVINIIVYCAIHYLLILILNLVISKKLDVFDQTSIYGNKEVSALISITGIIFIFWIIFIIIYKIIRLTQKDYKHQTVEIREKIVTKYVPEPKSKVKQSIKNIEVPTYIKGSIGKTTKEEVKVLPIESVKELKPIVIEDKTDDLIKQYDSILTLDDYKLVLNILKENKLSSVVNEDNKISIEKEINNNTLIDEKEPNYEEVSTYNYTNLVESNKSKLDELLNV